MTFVLFMYVRLYFVCQMTVFSPDCSITLGLVNKENKQTNKQVGSNEREFCGDGLEPRRIDVVGGFY